MMAVISVLSAKDDFNAARMIARPICPASAFAKAVQRPMMIFRPRLLRQQDQCQYHKAAIVAFQLITAVLQGTEPEDW
jgi:hypothetical protein